MPNGTINSNETTLSNSTINPNETTTNPVGAPSTRQQILAILENHRGQSISGADIAARLGISRNAVWKSVKELEKSGYKIKAANNRGYCLDEDNDIISVQGLTPFLTDAGQAALIEVYTTLDSTNNMAKEKALTGARHGAVIIADHQTNGRGRQGRGFFSPPGQGIYMSIILHPDRLTFADPTSVTAYAAVAVGEAIETMTGKAVGIKWVNDLFLGRKKICGILSEAVTDLESGRLQWIVVGIGINFRTPDNDYPPELAGIAGAIFTDDPPAITRNQLAAAIINRMVSADEPLSESDLFARYKQRMMMLGEVVLVNGWNEQYEARALDIDPTGRLIVEKGNGEVRALSNGEVSIKNIEG